ncbi:response regulator [Daejeonella lutea]|uniref:CheY chemotaxis protein or a CheY-like REC (Receiver) domain n=1 Tax=Daejeonella lutea TaxID=572036 RepID=A0A1T5BHA1_9SPHI|nr:response regulator [Daejeonella lutea]SKB46457.1 CheY chemotaxis protein or a CheY-like REC (receiver) domain [Daejeonella lutea]
MLLEKLNTVLCVNDNEITLFILKRTISKANFAEQIVEKKDGNEAFRYCQQLVDKGEYLNGNYPKVIFLDLQMPVLDGWEFMDQFTTRIWPFFKETKIVITSQSVDQSDILRAEKYPFVIDFLKHPISVNYLLQLHGALMKEYNLHNCPE